MHDSSAQVGLLQILLIPAILIPAILFLLTQQNTLKLIKRENRLMKPGLVWLQLIPLFGQVWQFFAVARIAGSLRKEISSRQEDSVLGFADSTEVEEFNKRPTFKIGMAYCILYTSDIVLNLSSPDQVKRILFIPPLLGLSGMICWIIYWVRLGQYKKKLRRI